MADNRLRDLSPEIGHLTDLVILSLRDNELRHLPYDIGKLEQLEVLIVQGNQMVLLPQDLAGCHSLFGRAGMLLLTGNPLCKPLVGAVRDGPATLQSFLRS